MRVLVVAGAGALALTMPLTVAIVIVLAVVVTSYQQTIKRLPQRGRARTSSPARTLAGGPAWWPAAALLTDYVLTVAVSIAAGVAALTSIFPAMYDVPRAARRRLRRPPLGRQPARYPGEREPLRRPDLRVPRRHLRLDRLRALVRSSTGRSPTYAAAGRVGRRPREVRGAGHPPHPARLRLRVRGPDRHGGCSNGVPAFKPPEASNAPGAGHDGRLLRDHLPGHQLPGHPAGDRARPDRAGDGRQPDHPHPGRRRRPYPLRHAAGDGDAPRPGREHGLRGLPPAGQHPGQGWVHAPPVPIPRRPTGVQRRDHGALSAGRHS